jgi:hypothetical protein
MSAPHSARGNIPAVALLSVLWRGGTWGMFQRFRGEMRRSEYTPTDDIRLPAPQWDAQHWNVYFSPTPATVRRDMFHAIHLEDVAALNCFFCDFDPNGFDGGKPAILEHIERKWRGGLPWPSVLVDSGGGYHAYWIFERPHIVTPNNLAAAKEWQARWVVLWGGDSGAKDIRHILRVPGTHNYKPERLGAPVFVVAEESNLLRTWPLENCLACLPPAPAKLPTTPPVEVDAASSLARTNARGGRALQQAIDKLRNAGEGKRNTTLFGQARVLFEWVNSKALDTETVERELLWAATGAGLSEREAQAAIAQGKAKAGDKRRAIRGTELAVTW